jgi:dihydrodipicolinate synthase/N-acetylneuraminate lyase
MDLSRLHGIFPPILTPLSEDERIDHESLASLVDYLLGEGVHGIWVMGTTGERLSARPLRPCGAERRSSPTSAMPAPG